MNRREPEWCAIRLGDDERIGQRRDFVARELAPLGCAAVVYPG